MFKGTVLCEPFVAFTRFHRNEHEIIKRKKKHLTFKKHLCVKEDNSCNKIHLDANFRML